MLDSAGWQTCKIYISVLWTSTLYGISFSRGHVDVFGVGERLITAKSGQFWRRHKLAAVEDRNGNIIPKIKM